MASSGSSVALPSAAMDAATMHIDRDAVADPVDAAPRAGGEQEAPLSVGAHGPPRRRGDVEQRLGRGVGIGGPEHTRAQSIAGHLAIAVEGEVCHELGGASGPVGRDLLVQSFQSRRLR